MKRVALTALIAAVSFFALHRPASAMTEFCPARLNYARVESGPQLVRRQAGSSKNARYLPEDSTLYCIQLSAMGPRTITHATLAFDTTAGWYALDVPGVTLVEKDVHYTGPSSSFIRRDYVSPVLYVRFPQALTVRHGWVSSAAVQGDALFGWDKEGIVQCDPAPRRIRLIAISQMSASRLLAITREAYHLDPKDVTQLSAPPAAMSLTLLANRSPSQRSSVCSGQAFTYAVIKHQFTPAYPRAALENTGASSVEIALDSTGKLADAWTWGPSGIPAFDKGALEAARRSTYTGGTAYCKPVPGYYLFRVQYEP